MSEEVLIKIKSWRLLALDRAFIALGSHPHRIEQFRKYSKGRNFNSFSLYWHKKYDEMDMGSLGIDQPIDKERFSPEQISQLIQKIQEIEKGMQEASYEPPSESYEIIMHLWVMYHLYKNQPISWPPTFNSMCLDFSFTKLLCLTNRDIAILTAHAEREETKNLKSTETKRKKAELWKRFIWAIYEHGESVTFGTRLSETIRMMQRQFDESKESELKKSKRENPKWDAIPEDMKAPKRDSIKDLFKAVGILGRDFENKQGYWFKTM